MKREKDRIEWIKLRGWRDRVSRWWVCAGEAKLIMTLKRHNNCDDSIGGGRGMAWGKNNKVLRPPLVRGLDFISPSSLWRLRSALPVCCLPIKQKPFAAVPFLHDTQTDPPTDRRCACDKHMVIYYNKSLGTKTRWVTKTLMAVHRESEEPLKIIHNTHTAPALSLGHRHGA